MKTNHILTAPTATEVMSFTQEQIESLPSYYELDLIKEGGFAKRGWSIAKSSLVWIGKIDGNTVYWAWANNFNGIIHNGNASNVKRGEYAYGGKFCTPAWTNPEDLSNFCIPQNN